MIIEVRGGSAVIHLPSSFPSLSLRFCVESGRLFFPIIFPLIKKFIFFFSFPEQNNNNFRFNIVIYFLLLLLLLPLLLPDEGALGLALEAHSIESINPPLPPPPHMFING